jgi:hypothetical protein
MKRRSCFLLFLLTLAGKTTILSAQTPAIQVRVYDYTGLSASALHAFITRTQAILVNSGLPPEVVVCAGETALCEGRTGSQRRIFIRVVADWSQNKTNARLVKLGTSISNQDGGTYGTVFLKAAEETAVGANLPRTTVLAYAAAHEIGHLLLGAQAHTRKGLMKEIWDAEDLLAMAQNGLRFSPEQVRELADRYGNSARANHGANTVVPLTARNR